MARFFTFGRSWNLLKKIFIEQFFVNESNKKQWRGRIISNFTKSETFHLLWQPSVSQCGLINRKFENQKKKLIRDHKSLYAENVELRHENNLLMEKILKNQLGQYMRSSWMLEASSIP